MWTSEIQEDDIIISVEDNMIKVGFIFPSSDYLYDPFRGDPHTHFQILTVIQDRMDNQVDPCLIDLRGINRKFAFYHIPECDVYLYSLYSLDYNELTSVCTYLRKRFPKAKHITGGPHSTLYQADSLQYFDSLIIGEGENIIIEALTDILNNKELKKIYHQTKPVNLNDYPIPSRKYLPTSSVARPGLMTMKNKQYEDLLSTTVMFSRGCPYKCVFCAIPTMKAYSPGIRYRKPSLIQSEIEYLKNSYGMEGISLLDEIGIPLGNKSAIEHLEAIGRAGIKWRGQTRVDSINQDIAKLAYESGCLTLSLGCESSSQQVLDSINKHIKVEDSKRTIRILKDAGIEVRVYLVNGLPNEPDDIIDQTKQFLDETQPDLVMMSMFTVRPGTDMFNNPKKYNIKSVSNDWSKMMNLQGRYETEDIKLSFEYNDNGFSHEKIISNFFELQNYITENGYNSVLAKKHNDC